MGETDLRSPGTPKGDGGGGGGGLLNRKTSVTKTINKNKERDASTPRKKISTGAVATSSSVPNPEKYLTGNKMRDKVRTALSTALLLDGEGVLASKEQTFGAAADIEGAMWTKYRTTNTDYKAKFRTLNFNLKDKKNRNLRDAVLCGDIRAERLIGMSNEELANDDLKKYREEVKQHMMYEAQPEKGMKQVTTDMWRCGKCKERKCTYYQLQTRSADEPMTTFITCVACGNRWTQSG